MHELEEAEFFYDSLSDAEVARLIFRKLYQMFDAGGISAGRSIVSSILEVYLDFARLPDFPLGLEPAGDDLIAQVHVRIERGIQLELPIMRDPNEIEFLTTPEFAIIAICELRKHAESLIVWREWSLTWFELVYFGSQLLGLPVSYPPFALQDFLQYASWWKYELYTQFDFD